MPSYTVLPNPEMLVLICVSTENRRITLTACTSNANAR